jgi:hypothetical protein
MARDNGQAVFFEEIAIGGPPPLRIEHRKDIQVLNVRLDRDNPRLRYAQALNPGKTLADLLFEENDTRLLKEDIRVNGQLDAVYLRQDLDGHYTAIEGNRRVACMHALHELYPDDPRFAVLNAKVLPPNTPEAKQALLMAQYHVAGKLKWSAHEKAGHIYHMYKVLKVTDEQLKATLHMGMPAIKQAIEAYEMLTERYCSVQGGKYATQAEGKWSFFAELYKVRDFRAKVLKDKDGNIPDRYWADTFCEWVGEGRIPTAADVRKLALILANDRANQVFRSRPADIAFAEAMTVADTANPASNSKFFKAVQAVVDTGLQANMADIATAAGNDKAQKLLASARSSIDMILKQAAVV